MPRGADAVVMIEQTELIEDSDRPVDRSPPRRRRPGNSSSYAGSDIARGETLLRARHADRLARDRHARGLRHLRTVEVVRKPKVGVLSTGDELVPPGKTLRPAGIYDSNGAIIAAAVTEAGGEPVPFGAFPDDETALRSRDAARAGRNATWWCVAAAPRRAPATSRIASSRSSASPAFSCMALRSSPASRSASRWRRTSRSSCCRDFRPRRSSPSMPSSRR